MNHLVFMLEEISMKAVLDTLLPIILPKEVTFDIIKHEGKTDLERSIPRKMRAYGIPNTKFIIVRDQDSHDCHKLKEFLLQLCTEGGRPESLVRIVCHELESWFLGDLAAVEAAYNISGLSSKQDKAKYRDPDRLSNPSQEIKRLIPDYQKLGGARAIVKHMTIESNCSKSFQVFIEGVRKIV